MLLVSAFHCLFRVITPNPNHLIGRLALIHSSGLNRKLFVGVVLQVPLLAFGVGVGAYKQGEEESLHWIPGLSFDTNEKVLRDAFLPYGEILEVRVIVNRASGLSKGFGFVQFASESDAVNALKEMDDRSLDGRNIRVNFANTRARPNSAPPRPSPSFWPNKPINID